VFVAYKKPLLSFILPTVLQTATSVFLLHFASAASIYPWLNFAPVCGYGLVRCSKNTALKSWKSEKIGYNPFGLFIRCFAIYTLAARY
jgi:hypothetical protein